MSGFKYNLLAELPPLQYKIEEVVSAFQKFIIEFLKKDGILIKEIKIFTKGKDELSEYDEDLRATVGFYERNEDDFPYVGFYFYYVLDSKSDTVKYINIIDPTSIEEEVMRSDGFFKTFIDIVLPSIDMVVAALLFEPEYDDYESLFFDLKTNKFDVSRGIYP
jgi:hypothetical protein